MVLLRPRERTLPRRTQRGGVAFIEEAGFLIADFATLFIDRTESAAAAAQVVEAVIEAFGPMALTVLEKAFKAQIGRALRRSVATAPEELIGKVIEPLSRHLCKVLPGCTADTISEEVADRKDTTVQGAHAWMLRPFLLGRAEVTVRGAKAPLQAGALFLLELDAKFSCAEHGDAKEMLRWYPNSGQYPGAVAAIERGCAKAPRKGKNG